MLIDGDVKIDVTDGVGTIEFYNPRGNSLPTHLLDKLTRTIEDANIDPAVKVIILTSEGFTVFCGGASFDELAKIENQADGKKFFMGFANVINAMRKSDKIIIVSVQGKAVGGGVGIAAAGDYVYGTHDSKLRLSELEIGIGPFVVAPAIERKVGKAVLSNMSVGTKWMSAEEAKAVGFYSELYESVENSDIMIWKFASKMAKQSPEAMKELKRVLWEDAQDWDSLFAKRAEISGRLLMTETAQANIKKLISKKK